MCPRVIQLGGLKQGHNKCKKHTHTQRKMYCAGWGGQPLKQNTFLFSMVTTLQWSCVSRETGDCSQDKISREMNTETRVSPVPSRTKGLVCKREEIRCWASSGRSSSPSGHTMSSALGKRGRRERGAKGKSIKN